MKRHHRPTGREHRDDHGHHHQRALDDGVVVTLRSVDVREVVKNRGGGLGGGRWEGRGGEKTREKMLEAFFSGARCPTTECISQEVKNRKRGFRVVGWAGCVMVGMGEGRRTEISASIALFEDSPRGETSRMMVISTNDKVAPAEIELEFVGKRSE